MHTSGTSDFATMPDGRRLHHMVRGDGPVTVVFESGMGVSRSGWGLVQPAVAEFARAVIYDRAGYGRSDERAQEVTLERSADDLVALLDHLGDGPVVLVGHSWGGPIVRRAAAARLDRMRGLVLVDPSDENADLFFTPANRRRFAASARLIPAMAAVGLLRLAGLSSGRRQPRDVVADHHAEDFTRRAARTTSGEMTALLPGLEGLLADPPALGGLPVTIITGTRAGAGEKEIRPALLAAHAATVAALPGGRHVLTDRSGHLVPWDDPQTVIDEIERMAR